LAKETLVEKHLKIVENNFSSTLEETPLAEGNIWRYKNETGSTGTACKTAVVAVIAVSH
jgi:hypothetical protein